MALQAAGGFDNETTFKITEQTPDILAPNFVHKNKLMSASNLCCNIRYIMVGNDYP